MTNEPALLNLVRVETIQDAEGLDSTLYGYDNHEEVLLATPDGDPCAMVDDEWIDNDIEHEYVSGAVGYQARRARHRVNFVVDFLGNETVATLQRWQRSRALVRVCPTFGRYTDIAYRPLVGAGDYYDLTGRKTLSTSSPSSGQYWWDPWINAMRGEWAGTNPRPVVWSPWGNLLASQNAQENVHIPGTPAAATEGFAGAAGWRKGGANSADITLSLVEDGFGHADAPDSIRVTTTNDASHTRYLIAQTLWDDSSGDYGGYEFTGAGTVTAVVWLKGRGCLSSSVKLYLNATYSQTQPLAAYDLSEWTPIYFSLYAPDWSTDVPYIKIDLSSGANAERADIEVGPVAIYPPSANPNERPEWSESEAALAQSRVYNPVSYKMPASGSCFVAFYCPDGYSGPSANAICYPWGVTDGVHMYVSNGPTLTLHDGIGAEIVSGSITLEQGAINVAAATWDGVSRHLYFNGELIDSATVAQLDIDTAAGTLVIGAKSNATTCHPLMIAGFRLDRKEYTATEVAQITKSMTDPVAAAVAIRARGRTYRITRIPSTPRNSSSGTHWLGRLDLEEVDWNSYAADLGSTEVM